MRVNTFFLCLWLVFASNIIAQAQPDTLWTLRLHENGHYPDILAATELANGDFAVIGISTDTSTLDRNVFAARVSQDGNLLWMHDFGMYYYPEEGNAILELPSGNLIIIGGSATRMERMNQVQLMGLSPQGDSLWSRRYGGGTTGTGTCSAYDGTLLPDGNLAVIGYRMGVNGEHSDVWLLKCTTSGDTVWTRMFGGDNTDVGKRIVRRLDGGFSIAGDMIPSDTYAYDMFMSQTDSLGNVRSTGEFAGDSLERCFGMAVDNANIYLAGFTTAQQDTHAFVVRTNRNGDSLRWTRSITTGRNNEQLRGICLLSEGGLIAAGWIQNGVNNISPWIIRISPDNGTILNSWIDNTYPTGKFNGIITARNRGSLAFGSVETGYTSDGFISRMAPGSGFSGIVRRAHGNTPVPNVFVGAVGQTNYATTSSQGRYVLSLPTGDYRLRIWGPCIAADTFATAHVIADSIMTLDLLSHSPDILCDRTSLNLLVHNHTTDSTTLGISNLGDGALDYSITMDLRYPASNWLSVSPSSGRVATADSLLLNIRIRADTTNDNVYDYYGFVLIHSSSCPDSVKRLPVFASVLGTGDGAPTLPREFALHAPYPNPFNPTTTLAFSLPQAEHIKLTVFNIRGQQVQVLAEGRFSPGEYRIPFDGSALASGIYTARLDYNGQTRTQKLLLLK